MTVAKRFAVVEMSQTKWVESCSRAREPQARRCSGAQAVPRPQRVIAVIDQRLVIEKILRHLGQWNGTPPLAPARSPPDAGAWTREPCEDVDPMPDYENVLTD